MNQLPAIDMAAVTKADIAVVADNIKALIIEGKVNPLEFLVKKKILESALEAVAKDPVVDQVISNELGKWPKDKASVGGAEISIGSRTSFNFKENPEWVKLNDGIKSLEERIKSATKAGGSIVTEDGEVSASPVTTTQSSFFTVKFTNK